MRALALAAASIALGCSPSSPKLDPRHDAFEEIEIASPPGLSDLTVGDHGVLWAIPERDRVLVAVTLSDHAAATRTIPLEGVPDGVDTEGIAWLGDDKLVISTEGQNIATAAVLWVEIHGDRAAVTRSRELTSAELGVTLTDNHGAEALCGTAGDLLVGIEAVGALADGTRYAPIARLRGDAMTVVKFRLTSAKGKLSALACTIEASGDVHGWAIERHFGVGRILSFMMARDATEVTPTIALDLTPLLGDRFNLEGIVALADGRVIVVNDNQSSKVEGPNELLVFRRLGKN